MHWQRKKRKKWTFQRHFQNVKDGRTDGLTDGQLKEMKYAKEELKSREGKLSSCIRMRHLCDRRAILINNKRLRQRKVIKMAPWKKPPVFFLDHLPGQRSVGLSKKVYISHEIWLKSQSILRTAVTGRAVPCMRKKPPIYFHDWCWSFKWIISKSEKSASARTCTNGLLFRPSSERRSCCYFENENKDD